MRLGSGRRPQREQCCDAVSLNEGLGLVDWRMWFFNLGSIGCLENIQGVRRV